MPYFASHYHSQRRHLSWSINHNPGRGANTVILKHTIYASTQYLSHYFVLIYGFVCVLYKSIRTWQTFLINYIFKSTSVRQMSQSSNNSVIFEKMKLFKHIKFYVLRPTHGSLPNDTYLVDFENRTSFANMWRSHKMYDNWWGGVKHFCSKVEHACSEQCRLYKWNFKAECVKAISLDYWWDIESF